MLGYRTSFVITSAVAAVVFAVFSLLQYFEVYSTYGSQLAGVELRGQVGDDSTLPGKKVKAKSSATGAVVDAQTANELDNTSTGKRLLSLALNLILTVAISAAILPSIVTVRTSQPATDDELIEQANRVGPQTLGHRFKSMSNGDALDLRVKALNEMLDRLEGGYMVLQRFTWDAAHQLRTPLAVLSARLSGPNRSIEVDEVAKDLEWMSRLVGQLLATARAGDAAIDFSERLDLCRVAAEVVSGLAPLAFYRGREIELCDADEPVYVTGNAGLLAEALSNLVENALAHTPVGTTVSVVVHRPAAVSVLDRGPGVPEQERSRIFERFVQGSNPTASGAGLGLSIVADVVKKHGVSIACKEREGGGAVFMMDLSAQTRALESMRLADVSANIKSPQPHG